MDAIANDYEDFGAVAQEVIRWAAERGLDVQTEDVAKALMGLIDAGFAKAYRLAASARIEVAGRPATLAEHYYLLTAEGRTLAERGERSADDRQPDH
jgi:hypothetical protein